MKKNQYSIPMKEDWKNYWAQRIIDSYNRTTEMNTLELTAILTKASQLMHLNAKVLSKDLLPQKKPLDVKAYIINTDNSDKPGEHWVTLYFKDDKAIYFDSYGQPPLEDYILPKKYHDMDRKYRDASKSME